MPPPWPVEVVPLSPVSSASLLWRMDGFLRATVVLKATFGLVPEGVARMIAPDAIVPRDRPYDNQPGSSIEAAGELAPYLPEAGVILIGHAYGAGGVPSPGVSAHISIFRERPVLDKTVHVFGDRSAGSPAPFQRLPLRYERAFGGPGHAENPVGVGALAGTPLPNLLDPADPERRAGFGPIAASWPSRRGLLDDRALAQVERAIPDLGADFPFGYYQPAPLDQRLDAIQGDEWIVLDGLHPALPRVRSRLPSARGLARASLGGGPLQPMELTADLLVIDADRQVCSVIWRGHLVLTEGEAALAGLRVYVGVELPARPIAWPVIDAPAIAAKAPAPSAPKPVDAGDSAETAMLSFDDLMAQAEGKSPVIPFASRPAGPAAARADVPSMGTPWSAHKPLLLPDLPDDELDSVTYPIAPTPPAVAPPPGPPPEPERTRTLSLADLELQAHKAIAPFAVAAPTDATRAASRVATPWGPAAPQPKLLELPPEDDEDDPLQSTVRLAELPVPVPPMRAVPAPMPPPMRAVPAPMPPPMRDGPAPGPPPPVWTAPSAPAIEAAAPVPPPAPAAPGPPLRAAPEGAGGPPKRGDKPSVPILSATPLLAVTVPWQVRPPKDSLTIVIKGTFDLVADGPAVFREEGEFPIGDVHLDDDPDRSLVHGSDLGIFKPRADVTLVGTAHAPRTAGGSTEAMQVSFQFGRGARGFVRRAAVLGDRHWQKALLALAPTDPQPFATMPLTWERAFGGPALDQNPVGKGHKAHAGADGIARLPNLEDPNHLIRGPGDAIAPVCFAPIAARWKERWGKLGTYDRRWHKLRWPYFPEDFDWGYFQVAPKAQQLPYLDGDEAFSVVGMMPDMPRLDGRLPGIRARCFLHQTDEAGGEFREIPLVLDTAAFNLDARTLHLVWRAFVEVSDEEAPEIEALFVTHEELAATPMTLVEARALYIRTATPAPPEETEPEEAPIEAELDEEPPRGGIAEARATIEAELRAAGIPVRPMDDPPAPPPPPPEPGVIAAALRQGGASEEEIAEVLAAITPPSPEEDEAVSPEDLRAKVIAILAAGEPFDGLDLSGANLADLDFTERSLQGTLLSRATLARSSFAGAKLGGANLARADLTDAIFQGADLHLADLAGVTAKRADFQRAQLSEADFTGADLTAARFDGAKGEAVQLCRCTLDKARFDGAELIETDLSSASLLGASFDGAKLPEVRLYEVNAEGASFRGAFMKGARVEGAKARKAMFINVDAPGSVWEGAQLSEASFHGAKLTGASFARATCARAVFSTADLRESRFRRAKLAGASFLRTNLMAATFERADLTGADLRGANLHGAETWKAKLDQAKLDQAIVTNSKLA